MTNHQEKNTNLSCVSIRGIIEKFPTRKGAQALNCGIWTYNVKDIEFQSFYELKN